MSPLVSVTSDVLDSARLTAAVAAGGPEDGAMVTFAGLVRDHNQGRRVLFLEYEAYEPLAVKALQLIVDEAQGKWPTARVGVHHRIGRLELGEASVDDCRRISPSLRRVCRNAATRSSASNRSCRSGSESTLRAATCGLKERSPIPTTRLRARRRTESHARDGQIVRAASRHCRHRGVGARGCLSGDGAVGLERPRQGTAAARRVRTSDLGGGKYRVCPR